MIFKTKGRYEWRKGFAIFPVHLGQDDGRDVYLWLAPYEWRIVEGGGSILSYTYEIKTADSKVFRNVMVTD